MNAAGNGCMEHSQGDSVLGRVRFVMVLLLMA